MHCGRYLLGYWPNLELILYVMGILVLLTLQEEFDLVISSTRSWTRSLIMNYIR